MTDRPLRFCMITTFYPPYHFGGDGIFVQRLSNELAKRGHHVEVIHCVDSYRLMASSESNGTYCDHPNVLVHGLKSPFGFLSPLATQQTGRPFFKAARIRQILEKGFDVIHYHNVSLVGGPKVLQYGRGVKLYTLHEYWLLCPTHVLLRFKRAACTRPHCLVCTLTHGRPPQWWRWSGLLRSSVRHIDAFLAPSRFCRDQHNKIGLEAPVVHLPNFIPPLDDSGPPPGADHSRNTSPEPYFLFVGRLEKLKGLQTLIPMFRHHPRARLLIAGSGSYEARLRGLAEGNAKIQFLGYVSGPRLQSLYQHAVALIVPSITFEISPLVIAEAFSQKTPVIARNMAGMPEMIKEGGGFTYDGERELAEAMDQLLSNTPFRNEMGERGYLAYQRLWTPEAHLKRYLSLINEIAAKRRDV